MSMSQDASILCTDQALPSYIDSLFDVSVAESEENLGQQVTARVSGTIKVMLFEIAGITFAIETKNITSITTTKSITYPGQEKFYYDLTIILRPEMSMQSDAEGALHFIHVKQLEYPLLCDFVGQIIVVAQPGINWRTGAGKRKWLAGTVPGLKCAILDVSELQLLTRKILVNGTLTA